MRIDRQSNYRRRQKETALSIDRKLGLKERKVCFKSAIEWQMSQTKKMKEKN